MLLAYEVCHDMPLTLERIARHPLTDLGLATFLADWAKTSGAKAPAKKAAPARKPAPARKVAKKK